MSMRFSGDAVFSFFKFSFFFEWLLLSTSYAGLPYSSPAPSLASVVTYSILIGVLIASLLLGAFFILHLVFRSRRPIDQRANRLQKVSQESEDSQGWAQKKRSA